MNNPRPAQEAPPQSAKPPFPDLWLWRGVFVALGLAMLVLAALSS